MILQNGLGAIGGSFSEWAAIIQTAIIRTAALGDWYNDWHNGSRLRIGRGYAGNGMEWNGIEWNRIE